MNNNIQEPCPDIYVDGFPTISKLNALESPEIKLRLPPEPNCKIGWNIGTEYSTSVVIYSPNHPNLLQRWLLKVFTGLEYKILKDS